MRRSDSARSPAPGQAFRSATGAARPDRRPDPVHQEHPPSDNDNRARRPDPAPEPPIVRQAATTPEAAEPLASSHTSTGPERRAAIARLMRDGDLAQRVQDGLRNHPSLEDIGARTNRFLDETGGCLTVPLLRLWHRAG